MASNQPIAEIVEEIFQSILANPKKQRRLYSKTFWDKFGFKSRTPERINSVSEAFRERSVMISIADMTLGKEAKEDWIVLTYMVPEPPTIETLPPGSTPSVLPTPPDSWFEKMAHRVYESEREVEYYFIIPLLEQLGYGEDDIAVGFKVNLKQGSQKGKKDGRDAHADVVVFDGIKHDNPQASSLLTIEAKRFEIPLDNEIVAKDVAGQARSYASWLVTPYYIISNGNNLQVYRNGLGGAADVKIKDCHRTELRDNWPDLYAKLNRASVVKYKAKIVKLIAEQVTS